MTDEEIYKYAIKNHRRLDIERMAYAIFAELQQAMFEDKNDISEEIANCEIGLELLKSLNDCSAKAEKLRKKKMKELYKKIFELS